MRVLVVSPKFNPVIGGGETFALDAVEQLKAYGAEVMVAVEPNADRNLTLYDFPVHEIAGLSDDNLNILKATDGLYRLLREVKPDVIHAHGYFALIAVGLANDKHLPIVASIHSTPVWDHRIVGGMTGFDQEVSFARQIITLAQPKIITAANDVYMEAAKKLVDSSISVVYMPYPILSAFYERQDRHYFRTLFSLKDDDVLLTLPSRIIERKGIREAVEALTLLPENFYLCLPCAIMPQDKSYWQEVMNLPAFVKAKRRVIIPNRTILHKDMPRLYAASDIVIMPSYYEGAPVATVEAMAARKPFIGADSQGINGFIHHGKNGVLVPKKDSNALADAVVLLAADTSLQNKLAAAAHESVAELTWTHQLPRLVKFLENSVRN